MKILSLFSGIGAFEQALTNLGINYELVGYCEIDKYASKSYSAIHNVPESLNLGDITKINEKELPKDIDLITYGFPCQDISLAGKQKGLFNEDGTQTRSGLFFEALRIIEETQPKIAIAENVKNLTGKKFKPQFEIVLNSLEEAGYNNYWQVLNAKDYGIPQNRERVFIVSIRKDVDTGLFAFPDGFPLELRLKDVLEDVVDEKYYLSDKGVSGLVRALYDGREHKPNIMDGETQYTPTIDTKVGNQTHRSPYVGEGLLYDKSMIGFEGSPRVYNNIMPTITSREYKEPRLVNQTRLSEMRGEPRCIQAGSLSGGKWDKMHDVSRRYYSPSGIAPTIHTCQGGNTEPKVIVREATKKGYAEATEGDSINFEQPNSKTRRGRVGRGVAQTLTTSPQQGVVVNER